MNRGGLSFATEDPRVDPEGSAPVGTVINPWTLLRAVRRQAPVIAVWVIGASALMLAIALTTPPTYRAASQLMLIDDNSVNVDDVGENRTVSVATIQTAEQVFRSRALALQVAETLGLAEGSGYLDQPEALSTRLTDDLKDGVRGVTTSLLPTDEGDDIVEATGAAPVDEESVLLNTIARSLQGRIRVAAIGNSSAFDLSFDLADPVLAAAIVNAYADTFVADQIRTALDRSLRTTEWLDTRVQRLEADARQAATDAELFRTENRLIRVGDALVSAENVDRFNIALTEAQTDAARIRARVGAYEDALSATPDALADGAEASRAFVGDTRLGELRVTLGALSTRREQVARDFGADHPQVAVLTAQIEDTAEQIRNEAARQLDTSRGELELAEAQVASLEAALDPALATNTAASRAQVELRLLEQRADSLARVHQAFLLKLEEARQLASFPVSNVRVLTEAEVPRGPIGPSKVMNLALGIVIGLLFGGLHALWRESTDRTLRSEADIGRSGLRFLGYLPDRTARGGDAPDAEAIRAASLRAARGWAARERSGPLVIGVSAVEEGDRSDVAADLAAVCGTFGGPALLIAGTSPHRAGRFAVDDRIEGPASGPWSERIVLDGEGVYRLTPSAEDRDLTAWPHDFVEEAAARFDTIIVDLPPANRLAREAALPAWIGEVVLVAAWGRTPLDALDRIVERDPVLGARVVGVLMADVTMSRLPRYGVRRTPAVTDRLAGLDT